MARLKRDLFNFDPYSPHFIERLKAFVTDFEEADSRGDYQHELVLLGLFAKEMCRKGLSHSPEQIWEEGL